MIQHLSTEEDKYNGGFSFEKALVKREVIKVEDVYYIRVTEYRCASEANGRPIYSYTAKAVQPTNAQHLSVVAWCK